MAVEWSDCVSVQADRDGLVDVFAEKYAASEQRIANDLLLEQDMAERHVSADIQKELQARRATSTPFHWGVKTILKVKKLRTCLLPTELVRIWSADLLEQQAKHWIWLCLHDNSNNIIAEWLQSSKRSAC